MGLGDFPGRPSLCLHMLGMHGTVYANYAVNEADLLLALGVRFDDRVTGKLEEFAKHGKIVHVDIDASEIHKNKFAHIPVRGDVKDAASARAEQESSTAAEDIAGLGRRRSTKWRESDPFRFDQDGDPASCRSTPSASCAKLTHATATPIITAGVGQHQMWAAQFFQFNKPRHVGHSRRPRHDGLRPARGDGRAEPRTRTSSSSTSTATAAS